jgi:excinuclease ABC subunit C
VEAKKEQMKADLSTRIPREVPETTGVYLFRDGKGEVLYIGKSKNLRKRMCSYFLNNDSNRRGRIRRMIFCIRGFSFRETASELEALLLEDRLIKKHLPPYNVGQKEFLEYVYLLLTRDAYPTLKMVDAPKEGERVFGPFKDRYAAEEILDLVHGCLGLRSCTDRVPRKRCLNHELQRCEGPCRDHADPARYEMITRRVSDFFEGDAAYLLEKLEAMMRDRSRRLDFEGAREIRERMERVERFSRRQRFIRRFRSEDLEVKEEGEPGIIHRFKKGIPADRADDPSFSGEDDRFLLDRANIVYNWIRSHE